MPRPLPSSRARRIAKRIGLAGCSLAAFAFAASIQSIWVYRVQGLGAFGIYAGYVGFVGESEASFYYQVGWTVSPPILPLAWIDHSPVVVKSGECSVALWLVLACTMLPTALLCHRDRRTVKPGCCRVCGYDLRASKRKCPECGTAIAGSSR